MHNVSSPDGDVDPGSLVFADGSQIRVFSLSRGDYLPVVMTEKNIVALDLDIDNDVVYWTDTALPAIKRSKIPGHMQELGIAQDLQIKELNYPEGISIDWMGGSVCRWCRDAISFSIALLRYSYVYNVAG